MPGGRSKDVRNVEKTPLEFPTAIPCHKGHTHIWPTSGPITMQDVGRCQVYCQFCSTDFTNPMRVEAKWGWYLRRHIYQVHRKEFPNLIVPEEWSGSKKTSKGKVGPKKDETKQASKKSAKKRAKNTEVVAPVMPTTPNLPAEEFNLGTYDTNAAAPANDTYLFDQLLASASEPGMRDLPADFDFDTYAVPSYFSEPTCTDPFAPAAFDEINCPGAVMTDLPSFEEMLGL